MIHILDIVMIGIVDVKINSIIWHMNTVILCNLFQAAHGSELGTAMVPSLRRLVPDQRPMAASDSATSYQLYSIKYQLTTSNQLQVPANCYNFSWKSAANDQQVWLNSGAAPQSRAFRMPSRRPCKPPGPQAPSKFVPGYSVDLHMPRG